VSRSSPTPVVDGERVYAFFESGDLLALTHAGDPIWQRSLVNEYGDFGGIHGVGSSLAANDETLFVLANHEGPSYVMAIDKATGENRWKVDYAGRVAWSSPIVERGAEQDAIVVSAAGLVEAYDGGSGQRLWNVDGLSGNTVPSATAIGEWVFIGSQEVASNLAINLASGEPQVAWRSDEASCNFMSPLFHDGLVYLVNRSGVAFCVDGNTGKQLWKHRLSDTCWASPLGAGDRVYFFAKDGQTVVARAGERFEQLAENRLAVEGDSRVYGYAAVDGAIVLRTGTRLICVGKPKSGSS
jgi:outer membrane protein assembly factor BamB